METDQTFERGDAVLSERDGRAMTVDADYGPVYLFRYRCKWKQDGAAASAMFRHDKLERAGD